MAGEDETRTTMGDKSAVWSQNDCIGLFADISSTEHFLPFEISPEDVGATTAGFTLDSEYQEGWDEETYLPKRVPNIIKEEKKCAAVYPYSTSYFYSPHADLVRLGAVIPDEQTYEEGTFNNLSMPMIAMSTESDKNGVYTYSPLSFKHLGALIHLTTSASDPVELTKIELTSTDGKAALCGTVVVEFNSQVAMSDEFKAALNGGAGSLGTIGSASLKYEGAPGTVLTMKGPISLSSTASNAYFAVLPVDYSGKTLSFIFHQNDGVKAVKYLAGHELKAGQIAQLPAFTYNVPFAPEASIEAQSKATWTLNEAVENYTIEILNNGKTIKTYEEKDSKENVLFDPVQGIRLDTMQLKGIKLGENKLQFVVRANFKDNSGVDAAYSVPVDFTYELLPAVPAFTFMPGPKMLQILNFQSYWQRLDYALLNKKEAGKEDFANIAFKTANGMVAFLMVDDVPETEGDYTYAIRAWYDTSKKDGYTEGYTYVTIEPTATVTIELSNEDLASYGDITIVNAAAIRTAMGNNFGYFSCNIPGEGEPTSEDDPDYWQDGGDTCFFHVKDLFTNWGISGTYDLTFRVYDAGRNKVAEAKITVTL